MAGFLSCVRPTLACVPLANDVGSLLSLVTPQAGVRPARVDFTPCLYLGDAAHTPARGCDESIISGKRFAQWLNLRAREMNYVELDNNDSRF
jgi:hypothetical protein